MDLGLCQACECIDAVYLGQYFRMFVRTDADVDSVLPNER